MSDILSAPGFADPNILEIKIMSLIAKWLTCERDERILFSNLDVAVNPKDVLHIRGENGVGKTSLLKILSGLLMPTQGSVNWQGVSINQCRSIFHQEMLYIGHLSAVNLRLSAKENLEFFAANYRTRTTLANAMARLELLKHANVPALQLSAGQRRRIALAKLCLLDVPLWILDEPYTALDQCGIMLVNQLIMEQIHREGMVILTSHQEVMLKTLTIQQLVLP